MSHVKSKTKMSILLSKKGTALPVTFLILFVSLTLIVSATYYLSVTKIQARGKLLNLTVAKQDMSSFEDDIKRVRWSPGASQLYYFEDSGSTFKTNTTSKHLLVNVTDNTFFTVAFNNSVGKAVYELQPANIMVSSIFIKGDRRAVVNQSAYTTTQLLTAPGIHVPEITLSYRVLATVIETGIYQGKPENTIRLYITRLSTPTNLTAYGEFGIKISCVNVTSTLQTQNITYTLNSVFVRATIDNRTDIVSLPITSNTNGAFVKIETLVCNIKLERVQGGG